MWAKDGKVRPSEAIVVELKLQGERRMNERALEVISGSIATFGQQKEFSVQVSISHHF